MTLYTTLENSPSVSSIGSGNSLIADLDLCAKQLSQTIEDTEKPIRKAMTQIRYEPDSHRTLLLSPTHRVKSTKKSPRRVSSEKRSDSFLDALAQDSSSKTQTARKMFTALYDSDSSAEFVPSKPKKTRKSRIRSRSNSVGSRYSVRSAKSTLRSKTRRVTSSKKTSKKTRIKKKKSSKPVVTKTKVKMVTRKKAGTVKGRMEGQSKSLGGNSKDKAEIVMLKAKLQNMSKIRAERDKYKEKFRRAQNALREQANITQLWQEKSKRLLEKSKKAKPTFRVQTELKKLQMSHDRALVELRHAKAQVLELSKSEKSLRKSLHSATQKSKELARKVQVLSLKKQEGLRKPAPTPEKRSAPRRATPKTRRYSLDSTSSTDSSSPDLNKSSRSIKSEPTRNLQSYDRYRKLKRVYQERYAS